MAVEAARDTFNQNDRAEANTIVKGEPRVLVVKGDEKVAAELVTALETERQVVDTVIPEGLPSDLAGLADYDSIVLVDVPRIRLTDKAMAALQVYVRDLGRGLVMVGGPRSYGAGGYTDTPLEETLPVDMGVRDREKQPEVALVVVIDKSGSMDACHCNSFNNGMGGGSSGQGGVRKVDIGKEAILRAASALSAQDELGVVAFDQSAHWVIQTAPLGGLQDIQARIAGINPDGQTNIFAGLDQAVQSLEGAKATRRHIILLTDGWSSSGQYDGILKQMKAAGITLSTVGAGGGSNPFLEKLAKEGGGRFYNAANPASIPDIFLKETQQVSGQQIVEEPFFPILTSNSPVLRGIDNGLPRLLGYNGTTAKPAAQTVLVTARDDPLLAQWQYGLGRSIAWTSDSTGHWARNWVPWQGFSKFFSQMVGWTFPGEESGGIEASFVDRGGPDLPAGREPEQRRVGARLLRDQRRDDRARPRAHDRRPQPGRVGGLRGADREPLERRLCRPGDADAGRRGAARSHARHGRAHRRRVPAAGRQRAAARGDPRRDGRPRGRDAGRGVGPRPPDDQPVHRPVAVAAGPGAAPVAAGHRAAARVARAAGAGRRPALGHRSGPRAPGRAADPAGRGAVRRAGPRRRVGRPVGDRPRVGGPGVGSDGERAVAANARRSRGRVPAAPRPRRPVIAVPGRHRRAPAPAPPRAGPGGAPADRTTPWPASARRSAAARASDRVPRTGG